MDDLNTNARALINEGRSALRAKAEDRVRIDTALRARLGADALPPAVEMKHLAGLRVVTGIAIGICAVGGAAFWALRPSAGVVVQQRVSTGQLAPATTVPRSVAPPSAASVPPAVVVPVEPHAPSSPPQASIAVRGQDRLAQEVALLARATKELRASQAAKALQTLAEHRRRFPNGALSEERSSATAQALCLLGRIQEGRAEAAHLAPQSPASARAEQVCDTAASTIRRP